MSIKAACVDRARVKRKESSGQKIEGTTQMVPTTGPWFRARLFPEEADERSEQGERKKIVSTPQLLYPIKDEEGGVVDLHGEDTVEVASNELGTNTYRVQGDPELIRKKRKVIGGLVTLELVVERPRAGVS